MREEPTIPMSGEALSDDAARDARREAVATMLGARSIAVVGASPRPGSFGERMVIEASRSGARLHLVNPRHGRIGDQTCAPSLLDLDESVDLALMGVPDAAVLPQLRDATASGARSAVLFGSANGLQQQIREIAADAGMALCGAGCMGFVNTVAGVRALGYLEADPLPTGPISFITHSGSAFSTMLRANRGFGFRLAVSSGQEIVTDTADYLDHALEDRGTRVIALLLETPRGLDRLREALLRAAARGVPVVALTVGGSPTGRAMVAAHSGAIAGEAAAWEAFWRSTGVVAVRDMAEFADTVELFGAGRRSRGGSIATVHDSGAERALTVDVAHDLGVEFASLADHTIAALTGQLDPGLAATNPLDVWGTGADTRSLFRTCLRLMAADPAVAVTALAVDLVSEFDGDTDYADAVLDAAASTAAPLAVLASLPSAVDRGTAQLLRRQGVAVLEGLPSGLAAMQHLARWPLPVARAVVEPEPPPRGRGFDLLAGYGIPVVATRAAADHHEVCAAAATVGYPVALKTTAAEHKSEIGGVVLGLADELSLMRAYAAMAERLGPGVTVSAMAPPGVEVSVGFVRDPAFGPLVVVAAGGTLIELLADRVLACPPISAELAGGMVSGLRVARLLRGWRGASAANVEALVAVIVAVGRMAVDLAETHDAVEANPVIVSPSGAVAVDVLEVRRPGTEPR